jgi:hypothetical protein
MPAELRVEISLRAIHSRYYGEVKLADVLGQRTAMAAHPDFNPEFALIIDLSQAERIAMTGEEIRSIAQTASPLSETSLYIFIAPADETYGIGRMYQLYGELKQRNTVIVKTLDEAKKLLESKR